MEKNDYERILNAVEDRFYDEERFSGISEIAEYTGISDSRVRSIVSDLEGDLLRKVYERRGNPTIYITRRMWNSLVAQVREPPWIDRYEFEDKKQLRSQIEDKHTRIQEYQELEGLLYRGGHPLEDSVSLALEKLGIKHEKGEADEDFIITHQKNTYIVEVKGKSGKASKENVAQLGTWLDKWIDKVKAERLKGILLINNHRNTPPEERKEPLTESALRFLKLRNSSYITTYSLFKLVKKLMAGKLKRKKAKEEFFELLEDSK